MNKDTWRAISDTKNPADQLVNPDAIPQITLDEGAMQGAGSTIKSAGKQVHHAGGSINRIWQGLAHYYQAPEGPQLFSGSGHVVSRADVVQTSLGVVGDAVWHFAADMRAEIPRLDSLRAEVNGFVAWAQSMSPTMWPQTVVPGFAGGDGNMEGWKRNEQLALDILGARNRVMEIENQYAGQILGAFSEAFDPPPGPPHPFHSRTEAEDAAQSAANDWRSVKLDGDMLPWGGTRHVNDPLRPLGLIVKGIGQSGLETVLALPSFVGLGKDASGHWGFSAKTAGNAWENLAKINFVTTMAIVAPGSTLGFLKNIGKGLVGFDAQGHYGWEGLGRGIGNIGLALLTRGETTGLLAAKGEAVAAAAGVSKAEAATAAEAAQAARVEAMTNAGRLADASEADRLAAVAAADKAASAANEANRAYQAATLKNWASQALSAGMKAPKLLTGNKLAFADVRSVADYIRNYDAGGKIPRLPVLPTSDRALTQQAVRGSAEVHGAAKDLDKVEPATDFDAAARAIRSEHDTLLDQVHDLNHQRLDANYDELAHQRVQLHDQAVADGAGRPPAERTQIWNHHTEQQRQLTEQAARAREAINQDAADQRAAVENRMYQRLDDLRAAEGMPPTPGHRPTVLPDAERILQRQFQAAGMDEAQAAAKTHALQQLTDRSLDQMSDNQRALVENLVAGGTNITEQTPMSKSLTGNQMQDYLRNNWNTVKGFITKNPFVHDAVRPVDRAEALALDYRVRQSLAEQTTWAQRLSWLAHGGKGQPYGLPLHGYGEIVYHTHPDDVDGYRIPLGGKSPAAQKIAEGFAKDHDHVVVVDDDPPFTGMGLTGGGVPEYYAGDPVRFMDGAKLYWYSATEGGGVVRTTVATFQDGAWHADRTLRSESFPATGDGPAVGRDPYSDAAHRAWENLPEANQEKLKELAHGGWAYELADKRPYEVPEDDEHHGHRVLTDFGYVELPSG